MTKTELQCSKPDSHDHFSSWVTLSVVWLFSNIQRAAVARLYWVKLKSSITLFNCYEYARHVHVRVRVHARGRKVDQITIESYHKKYTNYRALLT